MFFVFFIRITLDWVLSWIFLGCRNFACFMISVGVSCVGFRFSSARGFPSGCRGFVVNLQPYLRLPVRVGTARPIDESQTRTSLNKVVKPTLGLGFVSRVAVLLVWVGCFGIWVFWPELLFPDPVVV